MNPPTAEKPKRGRPTVITEKVGRRVLAMKRGGLTEREICDTVGLSKGAVSAFLRKAAQETKERVAAAEDPSAGAPVEAGATGQDGGAAATGSVSGDLGFLERELRELRLVAAKTQDPVERGKVSSKIGELTSKLARLRIAEQRARPPERDAATGRAGREAATLFRRFLEEALGESVEGVEAT